MSASTYTTAAATIAATMSTYTTAASTDQWFEIYVAFLLVVVFAMFVQIVCIESSKVIVVSPKVSSTPKVKQPTMVKKKLPRRKLP